MRYNFLRIESNNNEKKYVYKDNKNDGLTYEYNSKNIRIVNFKDSVIIGDDPIVKNCKIIN